MRLLICTQVIDEKDSALGFFKKWVLSLEPYFEKIEVICLKENESIVSGKIKVHSLGKEHSEGSWLTKRLRYVIRFYFFVWKLRKNYDVVFVHMNQEYVLLGGILWKFLGKKVFMWRNHYEGNIFTSVAAVFCKKIFCTSRFSYTARYKKTILMPVGVDEDFVNKDETITRITHSVLFLGRLDYSKKPHVLIDALGILAKDGVKFTASFVGGPSKEGSTYPAELSARAEKLGISSFITFVGAVPSTETYRYYRSHDVFVNCSKSGMFDKTMFEAVVCGCLVLANSHDFSELVGEEFIFAENDVKALAQKLNRLLTISLEERANISEMLGGHIKNHSLLVLASCLAREMGA